MHKFSKSQSESGREYPVKVQDLHGGSTKKWHFCVKHLAAGPDLFSPSCSEALFEIS